MSNDFEHLRQGFRSTRTLIQGKQKEYQWTKAENLKTYREDTAKVRNEMEWHETRKRIDDYKKSIVDDVEQWYKDKQGDIVAGLLVPPKADMVGLLDLYSRRTNVSEAEIRVLLGKAGDNYQSLKLIQEMASKNGYEVSLSVDFDEEMEKLEEIREKLLSVAEHIDKPENELGYIDTALLGFYDLGEKTNPFHDAEEIDKCETWKPEYTKFEKLHDEIQDDVRAGDFDTASRKALKLHHALEQEEKKEKAEAE